VALRTRYFGNFGISLPKLANGFLFRWLPGSGAEIAGFILTYFVLKTNAGRISPGQKYVKMVGKYVILHGKYVILHGVLDFSRAAFPLLENMSIYMFCRGALTPQSDPSRYLT